ncbi:MAG: nucleoside kinase [Bacilli bacterium]
MKDKLTITTNNGKQLEVAVNTKIIDIIGLLPDNIRNKVIGAKINNEIMDFNTSLKRDTTINFFDVNDLAGYKMYQAGLKFVLEAALKDIYKDEFEVVFNHSIMRGIHASIVGDRAFTLNDVKRVREQMSKIILEDLPFRKLNVDSKEAYNYFYKMGEIEKSWNIHNITNQVVLLYKLENYINYYYGEMPYSTRCLSKYDLVYLNDNEIVLMFPNPRSKNEVPEYVHYGKIIECFKNEKKWLERLGIPYVYQVNKKVSSSEIKELIRMSEVNFDSKIHEITRKALELGKKYIMVAGPSSSGKTTTTKKIALDLEAQGIKTLLISVDDYFKDRCDTPKNEDGSYNFECMEAIDLVSLNHDLKALGDGEEVRLPRFNFITGKREYYEYPVKLESDAIILMEGLHCLNRELTPDIPDEEKFLVYLSPFMPLNIDRHNYISTTDLRLIRRMIRDNRTRGYDVSKTIDSWQSVRRGEEKYIFPYVHQADMVVNTSLVYELGVLKVFAEPILYSVDNTSVYYEEARRLISFLKSYFPISSEYISDSSVLREFIGGSYFEK